MTQSIQTLGRAQTVPARLARSAERLGVSTLLGLCLVLALAIAGAPVLLA